MKIHKITIERFGTEINVSLPQGAKVLDAKNQFDSVSIWFSFNEMDDNTPLMNGGIEIKFICLLTGQSYKYDQDQLKYIDTVVMSKGEFVVHVFEVIIP